MSARLSTAIDVADAAKAILLRVQSFNDSLTQKEEDLSARALIGIDPMLLTLSM